MTNYLQILAISMSFNLNFPEYMTNAFSRASSVGNSAGILLSVDWLLLKSIFVDYFNNIAYLKLAGIALIPIALIGTSAISFRLIFFKDTHKFLRYLWVTSITIFFVLHPTLTAYCLRIFKWDYIGNGMQRVEMDIRTECWSPQHLKWIFILGKSFIFMILGIPMLIIYAIGFPVAIFIILYANRSRLNDPKVLSYFILLYQGLRSERYYWELVNTFRKFVLLSLQVFIPNNFKVVKSLIGSIVLFLSSVIQARFKPFKIGAVSELEHREMISSILTLYGGIIFVQEPNELQFLSIIIFVLVVIMNLRFWSLWIFWTLCVYRKHKIIEKFLQWAKKSFCIKIAEVRL